MNITGFSDESEHSVSNCDADSHAMERVSPQ